MYTETTVAENTLPEQEAPRKPGGERPMTMASNKPHSPPKRLKTRQREYEFRNTLNGARIITREMADYSAMIYYLENNNLHYFTFSTNIENPIKAVIRHLP
jgi:hypothetical protein